MLAVTVTNKYDTQQLTHRVGPLEVGRGPARDGIPRLVVRDGFVSRDHIRIDPLAHDKVRVSNLSGKAPLTVDHQTILSPGMDCECFLPVRLGVGETTVVVSAAVDDAVNIQMLKTVAPPIRGDAPGATSLIERTDAATPEDVVGWLEAVVSVQKAVDPQDYFDRTVKVVVDRIGLDTGLVLLRDGEAWKVGGVAARVNDGGGRAFSTTILAQVLSARRTFYMPVGAAIGGESLAGVQGVIASPIFDSRDEIIGAVYGTRAQRANGRELGPLEAQVVQLLAVAVGVGLTRHRQEAETQRLRAEKAAAEEADLAKGGVLQAIGQELKPPLTSVVGYSEMLLAQATADNQSQFIDGLKQVQNSGRQLLAMTNDILDYSQLEAGTLEIARQLYAPATLVREVLTAAEPLARANNNRLESDAPADLGRGVGDPARIRQSLLALIGNACKFTNDGTVKVVARRLPAPGGELIQIQVTDTGIGMSPEQASRLFQPFARIDAAPARKGGIGLGLAIAQKLCQAMGGKITVVSDAGKGSTFTMTVKAAL